MCDLSEISENESGQLMGVFFFVFRKHDRSFGELFVYVLFRDF